MTNQRSLEQIRRSVREIPDFPKPGILFYDVSTLFRDGVVFRSAVDHLIAGQDRRKIDALVGIEARGFVLASAMAYQMGLGLVLARKFGKLPGKTAGESYALEYGEAHIEIHEDAVRPGERLVVVDDLLATGGTAGATGRLIERLGGTVAGYVFLIELGFLAGRQRLDGAEVSSLLRYDR